MKVSKKLLLISVLTLVVLISGGVYWALSGKSKSDDHDGPTYDAQTLSGRLQKEHCSGLSSSGYASKCAHAIDAANLKKYSELASRDGGKLLLKLKKGEPKVFQDVEYKDSFGEDPVRDPKSSLITENVSEVKTYSLTHFYEKEELFLVSVLFWEGGGFILVDRNSGNEYEVLSEPIFSPDGKLFVTSSLDMEAGYEPNGVEVWQKKDNSWVQVYRLDFKDFGVASPRWSDNNKVILSKFGYVQSDLKPIGEASLVLENDQWQFVE